LTRPEASWWRSQLNAPDYPGIWIEWAGRQIVLVDYPSDKTREGWTEAELNEERPTVRVWAYDDAGDPEMIFISPDVEAEDEKGDLT
jgi:hypothetical protein